MHKPEISEYQGKPVLTINPEERFKLTFGLGKAKMIVDHIEQIKAFLESDGMTCDPLTAETIRLLGK